ncbi:MAG: U32 family peptidase [Clostridia bacterium]|nr:U32 family peptidase [Clostridia bacterium]
MTQQIPKPELLCPAGSPDALAAAIEGGADAIYVGGTAFNARIHAKNFTPDELRKGIDLAHAYGARVYITANTLIYDRETDAMLRAAEDAYLAGADALIVADIGCARQIRDRIPIPLHASTQLSGHNTDAARHLAEAGFSRMVCAREMSREDLAAFVANAPIEAEVFVHGALCVCHSGQCLFSSLVGGRSGNRGECAQPCRLPFSQGRKTGYPLSLKDLSLARHVPELCRMGIASFKIEGRMKSPEYVRDVARIWRRLIDENRGADDRDMAALASVFSRGGFTDGYYTGRIGSSMMGVRSEENKQSTRQLEAFEGITRKLPLSLDVSLRRDQPARLSLATRDGRQATVLGAIPEEARTAPLTEDAVRRSFSKLGNTPYVAERVTVELEAGLMLPVSGMNALRRAGIDALTPISTRSTADFRPVREIVPSQASAQSRSAVFYEPDRIPAEAYGYFDILYAPLERYDGRTNGVLLPSVIYDSEREEVARALSRAVSLGAKHVLVGNSGHLKLARESGLTLHGDFRLNVTNRHSAAHWEQEGMMDWILSPELTLPQLRDLRSGGRVIVYGKVPLMVTEKCVGKEIADCRACREGRVVLTDRRGVSFPVLREWEHRSLILNSVPVYMADRVAALQDAGLTSWHFLFTTETEQQIARLIRAYEVGDVPTVPVRRIKK